MSVARYIKFSYQGKESEALVINTRDKTEVRFEKDSDPVVFTRSDLITALAVSQQDIDNTRGTGQHESAGSDS